jgi:hypothetical protein
MLNICFEVLGCFLQSIQYSKQFEIKKKIKNFFDKLLKFVIFCDLFLQLRIPSIQKIVNTLKEQLNHALR